MVKETWLGMLKEKGFRITPQRESIIDVLLESDKALDTLTVYDVSREKYPDLGMVTVYRTIECLEDMGLLQKVHHECGCNKYLKNKQGHNHLLICTKCGKAIYFEGLDLDQLFEGIAQNNDFILQEHWLQLGGLCEACQT